MHVDIYDWLKAGWLRVSGCVPMWFVLPGFLREWSQPLRLDAMPVDTKSVQTGKRLDVVLGQEMLLRRQLIVPRAAKNSLLQAVDLNMRQSLPNGGHELIWRHTIEERTASDLKICVYLIKRKTLQKIEEAIASHKASVRTIGVSGEPAMKPLVDHRQTVDRPRRLWDVFTYILLAFAVGLTLVQNLQERKHLSDQIVQLEREKAELSAKALAVKEKIDAEHSAQATNARDAKVILSEHKRLHFILDLTEALDDDTWVSELIVSGTTVTLSGFTSGDVTAVMEVMRALPWVHHVDLEGPVTFDTYSRKNRFDLTIGTELAEGAGE